MSCYDNICGYLLIAGELTQQTVDFWTPMIGYCCEMASDGEEIANCLQFFIDNLKLNNAAI